MKSFRRAALLAASLSEWVAGASSLSEWVAGANSELRHHGPEKYLESSLLGIATDIFQSLSSSGNNSSAVYHRYNVSARDGTLLATTVGLPANSTTGDRYPAVIARSPYGPFSSRVTELYVGSGFAAVMQDDRGTMNSGGNFTMFLSAKDDGVATLEWIVKQPWSNGEVYTIGFSADGMGAMAMVIEKPPMLKGAWWAWTMGNGHELVYPDGVYQEGLVENYMDALSILTGGISVTNTIPDLRSHEPWSPWWDNITACRSPGPCRYSSVDFPVISSAGWWDIFLQQQLNDFEGISQQSDPAVRDKHVLFVSPLGHCALDAKHDVLNLQLAREEWSALNMATDLSFEFFKGVTDGPLRAQHKRLNFYVMTGFGNVPPISNSWWTSVDEWPTPESWTYYLAPQNRLTQNPPGLFSRWTATYLHDPSSPAPMVGGAKIPGVEGIPGNCGPADQAEREGREDVLVWDSEVLEEDLPVVGRLQAELYVSSDAVDTDFMVTVSDLNPGWWGYLGGSFLVRHGAVRMRWRKDDVKTAGPLVPGKIYPITVDLKTIAYVFPKGHRIRISVSSAAEGLYNVNYNTGHNVFSNDTKPVIARNAVHISKEHPSRLILPVVKLDDIPANQNLTASLALTNGLQAGQAGSRHQNDLNKVMMKDAKDLLEIMI